MEASFENIIYKCSVAFRVVPVAVTAGAVAATAGTDVIVGKSLKILISICVYQQMSGVDPM